MIEPFKLSDEMRKGFAVLTVAENYLGRPLSITSTEHYVRQNINSIWQAYEPYLEITITIDKLYDADTLDIQIDKREAKHFNFEEVPHWRESLDQFISDVKKPWSEWSEEELLEPRWIYLYSRDNGATEVLHNAMVLFSYKNPSDPYVKKYIEWHKSLLQSPNV